MNEWALQFEKQVPALPGPKNTVQEPPKPRKRAPKAVVLHTLALGLQIAQSRPYVENTHT